VCPVSGKIVEVNEDLVGNPELLNDDPFAAWMIKVDVSDESVFNHLMDSEHYRNLIK
jgi:glycine cleavage system H protein